MEALALGAAPTVSSRPVLTPAPEPVLECSVHVWLAAQKDALNYSLIPIDARTTYKNVC